MVSISHSIMSLTIDDIPHRSTDRCFMYLESKQNAK
uniref:Uncharacterized protein n=1 Tax=Arundo donax TaxID=35708 RepID=A0A0A9FX19_ARUDO